MKKGAPYSVAKILFNESVFLSVSIYALIFFRFLTGFLVAKFLGPNLYGLRTLFGLVVEYAEFSHLGTYDAMRREVPYYHGKSDDEFAQLIQSNVFSANILFSFFLLIVLISSAFYMGRVGFDQIYIDFILFLGFFTLIDKLNKFYNSKLIAEKRAVQVSRAKLVEGVVYAVACVSLTYYFGLRGLFIGLLLSSTMVFGYLILKVRAFPRVHISPQIFWGLLKIGFPIMFISFMFVVLRSGDRIIIAAMLDKEMLGYFAIGTIVGGLIYFSIGEVAASIFGPRIMERIGATGDIAQIKNYFIQPTILVAYGVPVLIGAVFLGIHLPVKFFMPEYDPSIGVTQILCLGAYFISIALMPLMVCVALNKQLIIVMFVFLVVLLNALLSYIFILFGFGIIGVAVGTCISYFTLSLMTLWYTANKFDFKLSEKFKFLLTTHVPFIYMFILLLFLDNIYVYDHTSWQNDVLYTGIKTGVFFLAYSTILLSVRKHSAFIKLGEILPVLKWRANTKI